MKNENTDMSRRNDDGFIRKILYASFAVIIAQGASYIYLAGVTSNQVDLNREINNKQDVKISQIAEDQEKLTALMTTSVTELVTQMKILVSDVKELKFSMSKFGMEQARRGPTVRRADQFMIEHEKAHAAHKDERK